MQIDLPDFLTSAPEWAQTVFWVFAALGAAGVAVLKVWRGVKDESKQIAAGEPPTRAAPTPPTESSAIMLAGVGGAIASKLETERYISALERIGDAGEAMVEAIEKLTAAHHRRAELDEDAERERKIRVEAERLADRLYRERQDHKGSRDRD